MTSPDPSLGEYIDAEIKVDKLKGAFAGYFQKYDVLLCPVIPFTRSASWPRGICRQRREGAVNPHDARHGAF